MTGGGGCGHRHRYHPVRDRSLRRFGHDPRHRDPVVGGAEHLRRDQQLRDMLRGKPVARHSITPELYAAPDDWTRSV